AGLRRGAGVPRNHPVRGSGARVIPPGRNGVASDSGRLHVIPATLWDYPSESSPCWSLATASGIFQETNATDTRILPTDLTTPGSRILSRHRTFPNTCLRTSRCERLFWWNLYIGVEQRASRARQGQPKAERCPGVSVPLVAISSACRFA